MIKSADELVLDLVTSPSYHLGIVGDTNTGKSVLAEKVGQRFAQEGRVLLISNFLVESDQDTVVLQPQQPIDRLPQSSFVHVNLYPIAH